MFSVYLSVISSTFPILTLQIIPVSCQTYYPSLEKGGNTELPFLGQFCLFPKSQWNVKPPHPIFVYVFVFVFVLISTCIKAIAGGTFVSAASPTPPSPCTLPSLCIVPMYSRVSISSYHHQRQQKQRLHLRSKIFEPLCSLSPRSFLADEIPSLPRVWSAP